MVSGEINILKVDMIRFHFPFLPGILIHITHTSVLLVAIKGQKLYHGM